MGGARVGGRGPGREDRLWIRRGGGLMIGGRGPGRGGGT